MRATLFILLFQLAQVSIGQALFQDVTIQSEFLNFEPADTYGSGVSAIDYDQDGDIDLYILAEKGFPNRLYENDGSGVYTEIQNELNLISRGRTALWFDFNGDNLLDVLVAGDCSFGNGSCADENHLMLFKQKQDHTFEDHAIASGILSDRNVLGVFGGLAAGDINNDGWLDFVTTEWGGNIKLFQNQGNETFADVTNVSNLQRAGRFWQPLLFDLNQDGWLDIYLTVDNQPNLFFLNNGDGTFSENAVAIGLANRGNDMGVTLGDFDNDQDFDVYVTNIEKLSDGKHNVLLRNEMEKGTFLFREKAIDIGVAQGGWGWGTTFFDADNDGLLDLAATNGWVTDFVDQSKLWKNLGDGTFSDISLNAQFDDELQATTLLSFDMDRDGDLDLAQSLKRNDSQTLAFRLLENKLDESEEFGNYVVIKPRMNGHNYFAIGSTVKIITANGTQMRPITVGISIYGQEPSEAHFGVGDDTEIESVTIIWPGGASSTFNDIGINQVVTLTDAGILHAPGSFTSTTESSSSIRLSWGHMSTYESEYLIERSLDDSFYEVIQFLVSSDEKIFLDTGLEPFTNYYYRVAAKSGEDLSPFGRISSDKTQSNVVILAPTNLGGEVTSPTSIAIEWEDNAENEQGYYLQRSLNASFASYVAYDLAANSIGFSNTNIEPNTTYYYRVAAYRSDGISDFSNQVDLTTIVLGLKQSESMISVYPNPNGGTFKIQMADNLTSNLDVDLINIDGRIIRNWNFRNAYHLQNFDFAVSQANGLYFLRIQGTNYSSILRLRIN